MPPRSPSPQDRPRTVDEALERADLALRSQRLGEAERLAADVLKSNGGNLVAARLFAQAVMQQGRADEAVGPLRRAARRSPDPAIETLLARALIDTGQEDQALAPLRLAVTRRPAFPLAFVELGDLLGRLGRADEAAAVFEDGLALTPDAPVLKVALGYLRLGQNRRAAARALFENVRAAAPDRRDAMLGLANVLLTDGDYAAAANLFGRALDLRPDDAGARVSLARCLLEMGERAAGEAHLRAAAAAGAHMAGSAITALTAAPHGRFFLRPSDAERFLGAPPT